MGGTNIELKVKSKQICRKRKIDSWDYSLDALGIKKGGKDEKPV